jgi:hypothetical protein
MSIRESKWRQITKTKYFKTICSIDREILERVQINIVRSVQIYRALHEQNFEQLLYIFAFYWFFNNKSLSFITDFATNIKIIILLYCSLKIGIEHSYSIEINPICCQIYFRKVRKRWIFYHFPNILLSSLNNVLSRCSPNCGTICIN